MSVKPRYFSSLFVAALILSSQLCGCGGGGSTGGTTGTTTPASLTLSVDPSAAVVAPGTTFSVLVNATETGTTATPSITLGTLPAGLTSTQTFPLSVPPAGALVSFAAASSMTPGTYSVSISGNAAAATATVNPSIQIATGAATGPTFASASNYEFNVPQGGSITPSETFEVVGGSYYNVSLSATGLPAGVTASFSPQVVQPGVPFTVTLSASNAAVVAQNVQWSLIGTPPAGMTPTSLNYLLLDVTPPSGIAWTNRTTYASTRATPDAAVYDPAHQLIYSSNTTWNRIDVISNTTHGLVKSIPVRDPRGLDISIDGTTIWVATGSQVMYGIDTTTLKATRYQLPRLGTAATSWEGAQVLSLADGTVMLVFGVTSWETNNLTAIWTPTNNTLTQVLPPTVWANTYGWMVVARSGDGKKVFSIGSDEGETSFTYDVASKTMSTPISLSSFGYASLASVNQDGSRIAIASYSGFDLYDGNLNWIGALPGDGGWGSFPMENLFDGGSVFSADGSTLYEETLPDNIPFILTINVATQQIASIAPAMPVIPVLTQLSPPFYLPVPFAVDSTGMVLGVEYHGIAFDDAAVNINYVSSLPGSQTSLNSLGINGGNSGPLSGGTQIAGGYDYWLTHDVYFGGTKGAASSVPNNSVNSFDLIAPPASTSGPVDIKLLYPDGTEVYDPQIFTYGTTVQDAILSGSPPQGAVPGQLDAFGLPLDPTQDTVTIGGLSATVTSKVTQYPPYTGEQSAMSLAYIVPSGTPGWADLKVTTPTGSGTLPKAVFYAKSVDDYAMTDTATFVLYDSYRNNLYLSAGDHIDVFSLASNSFTTPLQPPAIGASKQFQGLALTPDGKYLLAADLLDRSLAVVDPDTPSSSYAVVVTNETAPWSAPCIAGPLYVAADNQSNAYVVVGGVYGTACGPGGSVSKVNLTSRTSTSVCVASAGFVHSTSDGSLVAFGAGATGTLTLFNPAQQSCTPSATVAGQYGVAASGDGNVFSTARVLVDSSGNNIGRMGDPPVFYSYGSSSVTYNYTPYNSGALPNPILNAAGSLYYWAYPSYIDIVDVQQGMPRLRLSLSETVSSTVSPMTIDSGGQHIYLITNKGLTIVDLGNPPVSIGHLSQTMARAGTQVVVRGSGFETGINATVGGLAATVSYGDTQTLTLTLPAAPVGLEDIVLTNPDGTTYTQANAITVQ